MADINLAVNQADGRDAHTPYTQAQSLDGRLVRKEHFTSSCKSKEIIIL
ncbi:MAG: hypothetical protein IJ953_05605 [Campylobacter sp.]|nr:hypothetical protein [Campylobacter sp.]